MSAGEFLRSFYETDQNDIMRCRVQPETITGWNAAATGPATVPGSARMQASRRKLGVNARVISAQWVGTPPTGYDDDSTLRIPILTPAAYNALNVGDQVAYLGANIEIIGKTGEKIV